MPHFIIDCSYEILNQTDPEYIMKCVYDEAESTGLFAKQGVGGIKVRINSFNHYITVGKKDDFIHVFANIMEGRNEEQKRDLSYRIISRLSKLFPNVAVISINIRDFEKATYINKSMI